MSRIVVVEDETPLRQLIADELRDQGHEVVLASNGLEGLEAIERTAPDAVCCDVNMPKMNGLHMRQELDQRGIDTSRMTFVFVSAQASRSDIADGLMIGADHYVTKPIDFDRLLAILADA